MPSDLADHVFLGLLTRCLLHSVYFRDEQTKLICKQRKKNMDLQTEMNISRRILPIQFCRLYITQAVWFRAGQ